MCVGLIGIEMYVVLLGFDCGGESCGVVNDWIRGWDFYLYGCGSLRFWYF